MPTSAVSLMARTARSSQWAEVEMDLAVAGQPGLAEFVRREGEAPRIEIEVPAQQRPQAGTEAAPQLR